MSMTNKNISSIEQNSSSLADVAEALYSQRPKKYNCAQAVAKAFDQDDLIDSLATCGGGRAPDGFCGALYAALLLTPEEKQETMKQCFQQTTGNLRCKPIRQAGQTSCVKCIRVAAEALEKERTTRHK